MRSRLFDHPGTVTALIAVQLFCAGFFGWDALEDLRITGPGGLRSAYISIETLATLSLLCAVVYELFYLRHLNRRRARLETQIAAASGALHEVMQAQFDDWGLTPAERDVAAFALKGMSIAEIAGLRGAAEGTVKSQLNAVYRKAGVSGRGALLGLLVGDLLSDPLLPPRAD